MGRTLCLLMVLGFLVAGCATDKSSAYMKEGVTYGVVKSTPGVFRGRWWSYYERGGSFLEGAYLAEAEADYLKALEGRSKDTWRARTYGLHFVEYFPNRELGIVYFQMDRLDDAEKFLKQSLEQMDTARAHYYLDEITKKRIALGTVQDAAPPALAAAFAPTELIEVRTLEAPKAPEPTPVAVATPQPEAKPVEAPKPAPKPVAKPVEAAKTAPKPDVKPAEAPKPAATPKPEPKPMIVAEKPAAPAPAPAPAPVPEPAPAKQAPPVAPPAAPPAPEPAAPAPTPAPPVEPAPQKVVVASAELTVKVDAKDDVGVEKVAVNNTDTYQRASAVEVAPKTQVTLAEGTHPVEIKAVDLAGKEVTKKTEVTVDLTGPTIGVFSPIEPTVTDHGTVVLEGASVDKTGVTNVLVSQKTLAESPGAPRLEFGSELPLGDGENLFVVASHDTAGNETRSAVKVFKGDPNSAAAKLWLLEQRAPEKLVFALENPALLDSLLAATQLGTGHEIRLKSPVPDKPYRNNRTLRISGDVITQSQVTLLTINGVPFDTLTGAPKESFNRRIPIDPALAIAGGTMSIAIHAEDKDGGVLDKNFDVQLSPVDLATPDSHMPVAVLAFAGLGVEPALAEALRQGTETALAAQQRFNVLGNAALTEALGADGLAKALATPEDAIALGGNAPAHVFLTADLYPRDEKGLEIKVRVVNTATGDLAATLDDYLTDKTDPAQVAAKCAALAAQLEKAFPRISGEVLAVNGNDIELDWTKEDGLRPGAYIIIVRPEAPWTDETTGEMIEPGMYTEAGRAKVIDVTPSSVRARIIPPQGQQEGITLEKGMPAISM